MANEKKTHLNFFLPGGRVLSEAEIDMLPAEKRRISEGTGKAGVWMEVPCPGGSCVEGQERIIVEAPGVEEPHNRGVWLNIFCPEDRCLFKSGTELP